MPKISKVTKEETEKLIELVRENVPPYDQSSSFYSNAPLTSMTGAFCVCLYKRNISSTTSSLKQGSSNSLE